MITIQDIKNVLPDVITDSDLDALRELKKVLQVGISMVDGEMGHKKLLHLREVFLAEQP
jgi:hypothetical protein